MFYDRFHGNVRHKGHLQVLLINDKEHCKVEFRNTPYTTENNLLSRLILALRFCSTSSNAQVSHLFKLVRLSGRTEFSVVVLLPFSINLLIVYRESVNLIAYITLRLSADRLQL